MPKIKTLIPQESASVAASIASFLKLTTNDVLTRALNALAEQLHAITESQGAHIAKCVEALYSEDFYVYETELFIKEPTLRALKQFCNKHNLELAGFIGMLSCVMPQALRRALTEDCPDISCFSITSIFADFYVAEDEDEEEEPEPPPLDELAAPDDLDDDDPAGLLEPDVLKSLFNH